MGSSLIKIVLVVEYDGTRYCGFQFQDNVLTIQGEIEKAIRQVTGEALRVMGASRTDSGVHAKGQVVCFRTECGLQPGSWLKALNHFLPVDIAVREVYQVNMDFNVQREAVSRLYHYLIYNNVIRSPFQLRYAHRVAGRLNLDSMNEACRELLGEHDMASFVTDVAQSDIKSTLRTVYRARVEAHQDLVMFSIEANSFLPHQVRNTIGTLIKIGLGRIAVSDFKRIMEARKPGLAGPTEPAQGLCLIRVNYSRPLGEYHE